MSGVDQERLDDVLDGLLTLVASEYVAQFGCAARESIKLVGDVLATPFRSILEEWLLGVVQQLRDENEELRRKNER